MPSRQQLSQREIEGVLDQYALGKVNTIDELAAGSVYSPKVVIGADRGRFLLKRRARGLDIPSVVAFSHEVILGCLERGVCVPPLVGTVSENNSIVHFGDHVYELFVFIEGQMFDRSASMIGTHARQAGALLGEVHAVLDQIRPGFEPPVEPATIDLTRMGVLDQRVDAIDADTGHRLKQILGYGEELSKANARRPSIVHGDWHPGNMIYRQGEIVAVCDFDNTRIGSRARELAQAMIHFSLKTPQAGQSAHNCDPDPDLDGLANFWRGYASYAPPACSAKVCVGLMPAVMIDEALASIGHDESSNAMLVAVARKAIWIDEHQSTLVSMLESTQ